MREIHLTQGKIALVDDEDYEELSQYKWRACLWHRVWYAIRHTTRNGVKTNTSMHRHLMKAGRGTRVDHRDGNGLNNQRGNLRFATAQQNQHNRRSKWKNASSKFKGVYWHGAAKKWRAQITISRRHIHLGVFKTEKAAAEAYDHAAQELYGEFVVLNFPPETHGESSG